MKFDQQNNMYKYIKYHHKHNPPHAAVNQQSTAFQLDNLDIFDDISYDAKLGNSVPLFGIRAQYQVFR